MRKGSVIVLGPTDVGKSTLCVYLLNRLRSAGQDARIIDADIGQADIGPPTSIALSSPNRPITSLTELTPESMIFIGHTTPSYVEAKLIRGIGRLAVRAAPPITIINTDGWIAEREAISYKINLITQIQPQLVLGLGRSSELQPILEGVRSHILHVHAAENVLARSRADRKKLRAWRYRRFLEGGGITRTPFSNVRLSAPKNLPVVSPANSSALRNLMVGILDTSGFLTQIGILTDVESDAIRIYSRQRDAISRIELGFVKLTPLGREIGFI
jgi:polynucleotide 5'-kinase involved in rRNA processing